MKSLFALFLLFSTTTNSQSIWIVDSAVSKNSLQEAVRFLSQDSLKGRLTGTRGADMAATFISARFNQIELNPIAGNDGYFDNYIAEYERKKIPAKNVAGTIPGKFTNDTIVIFSAHYDHIGQKDDLPFNKEYSYQDDIFNGANDNATGVAALLEIARYYKLQNNNRYLLLFVAFSGEEMGMLGSTYLMNKTNPKIVKAVINLEMLGRPERDNCFIVGFRTNAAKNVLNSHLNKYQLPGVKNFFINDPYPDDNLARRSDHFPFAGKIKNAFTIMGSSPADMYYHSVDDEYETIDFDFLLKATRNIALACEQFTK